MTSEDDDDSRHLWAPTHGTFTSKRRKLTRACDPCRQRKTKCDAPDKREGEECTSCALHSRNCTFVEGTKRRGIPVGYVRYIENRVDRLEEAIKLLAPTYDIEVNIGPRYTQSSWGSANHLDIPPMANAGQPTRILPSIRPQNQSSQHMASDAKIPTQHYGNAAHPKWPSEAPDLAQPTTTNSAVRSTPHEPETLDSSGGEEGFTPAGFFQLPEDDLPEQFSKLQLGTSTYHGKSSNIRLLHHAMSIKNEVTNRNDPLWPEVPSERTGHPWGGGNPWERVYASRVSSAEKLIFPPQDLSDDLIALYFRFFHPLFPTLHRPSFEAQVKEGLHKKHLTFGFQFLLVCAVGSRWSKDPRVCETPDTAASPNMEVDWKIAGWSYFSQVIYFRRPFSYSSNLPDLQNTLLIGIFGMSSHIHHSAWLVAGYGVRSAMNLGAHRRKTYPPERPLQNEIWKRTFWCLVNLDRTTSSNLGRPPAINDEDIDVDLPLDVNDDSWDESLQSWKPNDSPSYIQYFIHTTKLVQIIAFAMRTIYSINRSRAHLGLVGDGWEKRIVSELDSALNSWTDKMPDQLRWGPNITDPIFFDQAVALNVSYHYAQIVIHRRFLTQSNKQLSSLASASLAICTNAARSISHIVDTHLKWILGGKHSPNPGQQHPVVMPISLVIPFLSGVVLLISIWGAKRSGGNVDVGALTDDVQKLLRYLKFAEERHARAARLEETLRGLASVGEFPLNLDADGLPARSSSKRSRGEVESGATGTQAPDGRGLNLGTRSTEFPLPSGAAPSPSRTHIQSHMPLSDLPTSAETLGAPSEGNGASFVDPRVANDTLTSVSSDLFSTISGSNPPWSNSADVFTAKDFAPIAPPVGPAMPTVSSSDIAGPPDGGPGMAHDSLISGVPETRTDPLANNDAFETAYRMLMGNLGGSDMPKGGGPSWDAAGVMDQAASMYFKGHEGGPSVTYGYPLHQDWGSSGFGGDHSQAATARDPIPQPLQPTVNNLPASSPSTDWESWLGNIWGPYDEPPLAQQQGNYPAPGD